MMRNGEFIRPLNRSVKKVSNIRSTDPKAFKERYEKALKAKYEKALKEKKLDSL